MEILFGNKHLRELFEKGRSRKYKLQPKLLEIFLIRIATLESAETIYDLWNLKSLHFEKLEGSHTRYSVRFDRQWRLELEIEWDDEMKTKGKITIVELSKHYGD